LDVELARRRDHQGAKRGAHTGPNPTDRAKSGRKRHLVTDARGVPIGLTISAANVPDLRHALSTIDSIRTVAPRRRFRPTHCCMDKGYDDRALRIAFQLRNIQAHIRRRGEPPLLGAYKGKARRWVVERTNGWHNRFRALLVSWERKAVHYEALCHLANAIIAYRVAIS
jgi:transposase